MTEDGTIGAMSFDCHWITIEGLEGANIFVFCSGCNAPPLYRNLQMCLFRARNVTPSKHGKHYSERSAGVPFYNWTTLHIHDFRYPPLRTCKTSLRVEPL